MRYEVRWTEERTALVEGASAKEVEGRMQDTIRRCAKPDAVKLLSIIREDLLPKPSPAPIASAA